MLMLNIRMGAWVLLDNSTVDVIQNTCGTRLVWGDLATVYVGCVGKCSLRS